MKGSTGVSPKSLFYESLIKAAYAFHRKTHLSGHNNDRLISETTIPSALMEAEILEKVDYLNIDSEGAEYDILYGMEAALFPHIHRICMETHAMPGADTIRGLFLRNHGCRARAISNPLQTWIGYVSA